MRMNMTEIQMQQICSLLQENDVYYSQLTYGEEGDYADRMDALYLDGDVSFELMSKILEIVNSEVQENQTSSSGPIYPLQNLQKVLDGLTDAEKQEALHRHILYYKKLVGLESQSKSIAELALLKTQESEVLYVILFIGEELNIKQSSIISQIV